MRILILSRGESVKSTQVLVDAATARGHQVSVHNPLHIELRLDAAGPGLRVEGKKLADFDVVIPRVATTGGNYAIAVLEQLSMRGAVPLNSASAVGRSRNSMRVLQALAVAGVAIPVTVMARQAAQLRAAVDAVGGYPVMVKLLHSTNRRGVMVCETRASLESALDAVLGLGEDLLLQQYVKRARDVARVVVVGEKAVAAVRRKSNAKAGRAFEKAELTAELAQVAQAAAAALALDVCAIDLLEAGRSPRAFEAHATPAIAELERATGVEIGKAIIAHAEVLLVGRTSNRKAS